MPYFQRTRLPGNALAPTAEGERPASGIVERAVSILDKQLATDGVHPTTTRPAGSATPAPPEAMLEMGDTWRRVRELLRELVDLLGTPGVSAPASVRAAVPIATTAPVLQSRPVHAGETLTVTVPVANDRANPADLIFYSTDFVSDGGVEIPSVEVTFCPRTMTLAPHTRAHTEMKIAVPARSPAGLYSALVQATGLSVPPAVVVLEVE